MDWIKYLWLVMGDAMVVVFMISTTWVLAGLHHGVFGVLQYTAMAGSLALGALFFFLWEASNAHEQ